MRIHYITTQPLISYYALLFRFRSTDKPYLALISQALNKLQYTFGTQTYSIVSFLGPLVPVKLGSITWRSRYKKIPNLKKNLYSIIYSIPPKTSRWQTNTTSLTRVNKKFSSPLQRTKDTGNLVRVAPDCKRSYCEDSFSGYSGSV